MCGIAGFIDLKGTAPATLLERRVRGMADALRHRGPDDSGVWCDEAVGIAMGFRRLAIIDVSPSGAQPMISACGRWVMTFNGEIYNFPELRAELAGQGAVFRGHSDSEVMLEHIARHGVEATLAVLVGMFAIALWDRRRRELWLVRDRMGIKPLYFGRCGDLVLWGSELKSLRAHDGWQGTIDPHAVAQFLRFNYVPAPRSIYAGIGKLRPGGWACFTATGQMREGRYWSLAAAAQATPLDMSDEEATEECEHILGDAVRRRMVADVPLGAFLSGGIDSSSVVALMQQHADRPVKTFCVGFDDSDHDESRHARAVAAHLGTDHHEMILSPAAARDLIPNLPVWHDEPFADSSSLPTFLVCQMARREVTVALSGDGGDEVFQGYTRYRALHRIDSYANILPGMLRRFAAGGIRLLGLRFWDGAGRVIPASRRPHRVGQKAMKFAHMLEADGAYARYLALVSHWTEEDGIAGAPMLENWPPPGAPEGGAHAGAQAAYADSLTYLPDDILTKVDRTSMAVSLEARVPILDHRVVEFAWRLPARFTYRDGDSKWLLRRVLDRHVPRRLVDRPKSGFGVPLAAWLTGSLRDWTETLLAPERLRQSGFVNPAPVARAWTQLKSGRGDRAYALWGVLMLEAWAEENRRSDGAGPK